MKLFCVVAAKDAPQALFCGLVVNQNNLIKNQNDCLSALGQASFEHNGAVLFEIHDKIAKEDFDGNLFVEASDIHAVDPESIGMDDAIVKCAYDVVLQHKSTVRKHLIKMARELSEEAGPPTFISVLKKIDAECAQCAVEFVKEYHRASTEAKKENIKNGEKAALMMAIRKVGV